VLLLVLPLLPPSLVLLLADPLPPQTGSAYGDHATMKEPYNRLQAVVSTLSKGPVAPSDKIGRSDAKLIMRSCAADGRLLQGDKPAMQLDSLHAQLAFVEKGPANKGGQECRVSIKMENPKAMFSKST